MLESWTFNRHNSKMIYSFLGNLTQYLDGVYLCWRETVLHPKSNRDFLLINATHNHWAASPNGQVGDAQVHNPPFYWSQVRWVAAVRFNRGGSCHETNALPQLWLKSFEASCNSFRFSVAFTSQWANIFRPSRAVDALGRIARPPGPISFFYHFISFFLLSFFPVSSLFSSPKFAVACVFLNFKQTLSLSLNLNLNLNLNLSLMFSLSP